MSSKTLSKRRYQPAAEIDDASLARKREYWRCKKREQRARKSSAKKKIRNENLRLCMSVVSHEPFVQIPKVSGDPTVSNGTISCKLEKIDASKNSFSSESNLTSLPCQKDRWFQKTKLNHVLPQIQKTSASSMKAVKGSKNIKPSVTRSSNTDAKTVESSYPTSHCLELHSSSAYAQKTGMAFINGKQLAMSLQKHASMVLPVQSNQNNSLRPLNSAECKAYEDLHSHITRRRTCAFASKHNTKEVMTEEEMAAKRRENWRIKKREQRAKRAARPAREQGRSLGQGKTSCLGNNLNSVNPGRKMGAKCYNFRTTRQHVQGTKPNHAPLSSCILQPSLHITRTLNKSKVPMSARTQDTHGQIQIRKPVIHTSKVESPEDRHARQKEYWRIKKREQRARLAMGVKARLKERDALKHHVRSHHNPFKQMHSVQKSKTSTLGGSSQVIGGFIKEDGTMTGSISKSSPKASLSATYNFSNAKSIGKAKHQVQVGSPLYSHAQPVRLAGDAVMGSMTITIQPETLTEEERITRLREYWRIKKQQQRASRAARLGKGLIGSKVVVFKQKKKNKQSNQRHSVPSSTCESSTNTSTSIKEEHIYPSINAVFSIPRINPCSSNKDNVLESPTEPPTAVDHHSTTLQAVASMKQLLEELVGAPKDNAIEMHLKCENEPIQLTKDDHAFEDAKPLAEETSFNVVKLRPQASTLEDTGHHKSCDINKEAVQPRCRDTQKFRDDGADLKKSCPLQALQEQQLGESDELQRKREYWRLMKRQQRARKANKDAAIRRLASQTLNVKQSSTSVMQDISQHNTTCRQFPVQKKRRWSTKPLNKRRQIMETPNLQEDPEEVIRRRRMQWRIKKQEQRARKAAHERKLRQMMATPHGQATQKKESPTGWNCMRAQNTNSSCSAVVQRKNPEDHLDCLTEPCQTALKEESSFPLNDAAERPLSQAEWRNLYLMDLDPVIPLLVCMVCGEQQYSVSVEGVKTHIEDVHPHTLLLEDLKRRSILNAWDKQVAVREHFITHQLQRQ